MGCRNDYMEETPHEKLDKFLKTVDTLADYLCTTFTELEVQNLSHLIPQKAKDWWEQHKKLDLESENWMKK